MSLFLSVLNEGGVGVWEGTQGRGYPKTEKELEVHTYSQY